MSRDLGRDVPDLEKLYARNFGLILRSLYYGAHHDYTHTHTLLLICELIPQLHRTSVTQGLSGRNSLV